MAIGGHGRGQSAVVITEIKNVVPEPKLGSTDKNQATSTDLTKRHDDVTPYQKNLTVSTHHRMSAFPALQGLI